jgi:hypothetical protein
MSLRIEFRGDVSQEPEAYLAACRRLLRWGGENTSAIVYVSPRREDGWLEWAVSIVGSMTIHMVQRTPGAEWEWHS